MSRATPQEPRFIPAGAGNRLSCRAPRLRNPGSSPRVRGTGIAGHGREAGVRFIPAGAGNRGQSIPTPARAPVHPRGCGEQSTRRSPAPRQSGSSPRVRGTGRFVVVMGQGGRFIPAGAGNSARRSSTRPRRSVHPRGCGEQGLLWASPDCKHGSSPRVRGTVEVVAVDHQVARFIPAGAGNSSASVLPSLMLAVHPRGCGEQVRRSDGPLTRCGSSPRVRGTDRAATGTRRRCRFIPAGAGNSPCSCRSSSFLPVHPRGCGEQVPELSCLMIDLGSSPRVRGTVALHFEDLHRDRFIPAGAGNRRWCAMPRPATAVHPRGCGEQRGQTCFSSFAAGSSPRVRGTADHAVDRREARRFIPAGAGNSRA